ncbi:unnamed protein product [Brassica oleracea]
MPNRKKSNIFYWLLNSTTRLQKHQCICSHNNVVKSLYLLQFCRKTWPNIRLLNHGD